MTYEQAASLPVYAGQDLGAVYSKRHTAFALWAPTAATAAVHRFATGTDGEPGAADLGVTPMHRTDGGVWRALIGGDLAGQYYLYELTFPDGHAVSLVDPYARSAGANGQRGMILDLDAAAPAGWAADRRPAAARDAAAASVWEVHVADFSADAHSGVRPDWRGKFLAFTQPDTTLDQEGAFPTCLNYLKHLGVSHVQLQPIFDFATVDETVPGGYNWGYDPLNYNVPEGSYATDPWHGEVRVRECRAMIAALHRAGIGVIMDVVYNHTYHADNWMERAVPGYWLRRWADGALTNGSGCGCDLASERTMVRKYIVDSVVYWATAYHIDGFRFDLMGLHDVDTMNAIRAALDALPGGREILMYGEPWQGGSTRMDPGAHSADKGALPLLNERVGVFCDNTRDTIKGGVFDARAPGFVNGAPGAAYTLLHAVGAFRDGSDGMHPKAANQIVQYVSAHDNFTLWDKLKAVAGRADCEALDDDLLAQNRLCAGIYLTCQGLPFMQAGEEFARTKHGDPNTYRGPLSVNRLDWTRAARLAPLVEYYRGLLAIRRTWPELSALGDPNQPLPLLLALPGWLVGFVPERTGESRDPRLVVYYNPDPVSHTVPLPAGCWRTLSDGVQAGTRPFGPIYRGEYPLPAVRAVILTAVPTP